MMKILAIDTSTMLGGIAITDDSLGLIAEVRLNVKSTHSERLMTEIDHILRQAGLTLSDMDVFAVAIGPGSFTGLRIGLSTIKGFSYATGKPIVSVPTLEALAWNFSYSRYPVCTMLDARKKEIYAALFKWDNNGFVRLIDEVSTKVKEFLGNVKLLTNEFVIFTGEGSLLYRDKIIEGMGGKAIIAPHEKIIPSPANVAFLGLQKAREGNFSEPISLVPFYIRRSEAEIKRDG
ncbi:MAG: tRNA (adenosine(37)-N6)-threonylcarbamoyltransferase complex dimerization subunit type 1 TsaB [Nitrospirota bacterium]|nr:tRNA (adenosine(37)-N6)-threonylcarbamoyltransferase complex dimerization subunit type 1 TsaB [Nitrospirota bacterium]MDH5769151.1 tRNA (adenosine(37)-N6)-threonylcarbamoyltransferase complex dimerization subunit type 1 TsaB [Nitrospirota bacterium]